MAQQPPLTFGLKLAYGLGAVPFGVKDAGLQFFLLLYYNQVLGLPATWVGAAATIALCADAAADPLIGYWSDNLRSRWGRRHPPMYASALPIALAYGLLWDPPAGLSQGPLFLYLLSFTVLVRLLISFYEVPNAALAPDLTEDYDERNAVLGYRVFFGYAGGIGMVVLAFVVFLRPPNPDAVAQLYRPGYVAYGWASGVMMAVTGIVSALGTHRRIPLLKAPPPRRALDLQRSAREILESLSHRSLRTLLLAILCAGLAGGMGTTLGYYYTTFFWELSGPKTLLLLIGLFIGAGLATPLGAALSRRLGKRAAANRLVLVSLFIGPAPQLLRLVGWFPANGDPALLPLLFLHSILATGFGVAAAILILSMITDIVEDSQVATGRRSEGLFLASASFVTKCATGIGILISGMLIDLIGFPTQARPGAINPAILRHLVLAYTPAITVLYLLMLTFLSRNRIDRARHEANLKALATEGAAPL